MIKKSQNKNNHVVYKCEHVIGLQKISSLYEVYDFHVKRSEVGDMRKSYFNAR